MVIRDKCTYRDEIRIDGLTNDECRLLSKIFTQFRPSKGLRGVQHFDDDATFPCYKLSSHVYKIAPDRVDIEYFGRDGSAMEYLSDVLNEIKSFNKTEHCPLVPLFVEGDGHCLVHAISRCLVGREIYWHALMVEMQRNLKQNKQLYQKKLHEFYSPDSFNQYIKEADPDYKPPPDTELGLSDLHIFALANILHRPIFLFDGEKKIQKESKFAFIFLPVFDEGSMQKEPIFIAWSSRARNHFVPLVGRKDMGQFHLPDSIIPHIWGPFNIDYKCSAYGKGAELVEGYWKNIVPLMEQKFMDLHEISVDVVAAYYHKVEKATRQIALTDAEMIEAAKEAVSAQTLMMCVTCRSIEHIHLLHVLMIKHNLAVKNCDRCSGALREIKANGEIMYVNGDYVKTRDSNYVESEMKVYWDGELYDNVPESISITIPYSDVEEKIEWFYRESDPSKKSNAYEIADRLIVKHNINEYREHLISKIAEEILNKTAYLYRDDAVNSWRTTNISNQMDLQGSCEKVSQNKPLFEAASTEAVKEHRSKGSKKLKAGKVKKEQGNAVKSQTESECINSLQQPAKTCSPKICLSFSGKKVQIEIVNKITYKQLQSLVKRNFGIEPEKQILKRGFPRTAISQPEDENTTLCLKHGDTVIVDKCLETDQKPCNSEEGASEGTAYADEVSKTFGWNIIEEIAIEEVLRKIEELTTAQGETEKLEEDEREK
ncbi:deubiquitinating protein VCPIP1-like [Rhopilema esculentum]|uniref:deubiquitinating protein VCPIP1-like n=1 Tax=Rhopilema esculentum TaxID=499914 RepID=UPI0031E090E8|eukprot:gene12621-3327_t